ncbi:MAG: phenylalanine--tRNA ligase subunit alpha [Candidatus Colwellbacteria bacterium]|jgi:phenylalanyl-tRNA synthetase alpha chain|nr:phenylalanine--tRNA ligase subunit alpha [Candidatus Colwellbacteria bacterium]MCK9497295.1 phenylalanine--tRNA ligase subunit alpha [Candidatus Colwellbacteria bacterium]MDD3752780.1 phenylalanine--tRNA ligase subunit alpha [Candidatus Colwellbacteria bacterium]MDD4818767.1 phenylalanine--tRNA ligase subunit alpha [Candidatus Colwellbacteria bacterium]
MNIDDIRNRATTEINGAISLDELKEIRLKYLGRKKGEITLLLKSLKALSDEDKRKFGPQLQEMRENIEQALVFKKRELSEEEDWADVTLPGKRPEPGHLNLITQTETEIRRIFNSMNFSVIDGPEMEDEYHNFDALNIPAWHPAREMWDTFWIKTPDSAKKKYLLRTHTSPVQIRYMETHKPPFQIISPGKTFRYEATDSTHETNFYQLEGLMVGKDISLAHLKFVISEFFRQFFSNKNVKVRLRSSYFPFVEPGVEIDIKLDDSDWLEVAGAGMVHPKVFKYAGYNPKEWQGFAFGFGLERLIMVKYGISDIRLFNSGDLKFIKKF